MPDIVDSSSNATLASSGTLENNNTERDGHEGDDERTDGGETLERGSPERDHSNNESNASDGKQPSFEDPQIKPMPIRKKHRRGSKRNRRKYKPYSKLSWEEKKAVEERDTKRAYQMRERYMNEKGRPTAPYNTTQFLMAEHDVHEPDLGSHTHVHSHSESVDSVQQRHASVSADDSEPDDCYDSPEDDMYEQQFFEKDFSETYEQLHEENLHSMSKNDLVREFIQLENRVDSLEKKIVVGESDRDCNGLERQTSLEELCLKINGERTELTNDNIDKDEFTSDDDLRAELNRLRQENTRLQNENLELRNQIPYSH